MRNARNNASLKKITESMKPVNQPQHTNREKLSQVLLSSGLTELSDMLSPQQNSLNSSLRKSSVIAPMMYSPQGLESSQQAIRAVTNEHQLSQKLDNVIFNDTKRRQSEISTSPKIAKRGDLHRVQTPANPLHVSTGSKNFKSEAPRLTEEQQQLIDSLKPVEKYTRKKELPISINFQRVQVENDNMIQNGVPINVRFGRSKFNPYQLLLSDMVITNALRNPTIGFQIKTPIQLNRGHIIQIIDVIESCYPELSGLELEEGEFCVVIKGIKATETGAIYNKIKAFVSQKASVIEIICSFCTELGQDTAFWQLSEGKFNENTLQLLLNAVNMMTQRPFEKLSPQLLMEVKVKVEYQLPAAPLLDQQFTQLPICDVEKKLQTATFVRTSGNIRDFSCFRSQNIGLFFNVNQVMIYRTIKFVVQKYIPNMKLDFENLKKSNVSIENNNVTTGVETPALLATAPEVATNIIKLILKGNLKITAVTSKDWFGQKIINIVINWLHTYDYFPIKCVKVFQAAKFNIEVELDLQYSQNSVNNTIQKTVEVQQVEGTPKTRSRDVPVFQPIQKKCIAFNFANYQPTQQQFGVNIVNRSGRLIYEQNILETVDKLVFACENTKVEQNIINQFTCDLDQIQLEQLTQLIKAEYPELFDVKLTKEGPNLVVENYQHEWLNKLSEIFVKQSQTAIYDMFKFILSKCVNYSSTALLSSLQQGFYNYDTVRLLFVFFFRKSNIAHQIEYVQLNNETVPIFKLKNGYMKPIHTLVEFAPYRALSPHFIPPYYCPDAEVPKCTMLSNSTINYSHLQEFGCYIYKSNLPSFADLKDQMPSVVKKFLKVHNVKNFRILLFEDEVVGLVGQICYEPQTYFDIQVFQPVHKLKANLPPLDRRTIREEIVRQRLEIVSDAMNDEFIVMSPGISKLSYNEDGLMGLNLVAEQYNFDRLNRLTSYTQCQFTVFVNLIIANENSWPLKVVQKFNLYQVMTWTEAKPLVPAQVLVCGSTLKNQILAAFNQIQLLDVNQLEKAQLFDSFLDKQLQLDSKINVGYSDSTKPLLINQFVYESVVFCVCFELNLELTSVNQIKQLGISVPVNFFEEPNVEDLVQTDNIPLFIAQKFLQNTTRITLLDANDIKNNLREASVMINRLNLSEYSLDLVAAQKLGSGMVLSFNQFDKNPPNYYKYEDFQENTLQFGVPKMLRNRNGYSRFALYCVDEIIHAVAQGRVLVQQRVDKYQMQEINSIISLVYPELTAYVYFFSKFGIQIIQSQKYQEYSASIEKLNKVITEVNRNPTEIFQYVLSNCVHFSLDAHVGDLLANHVYSYKTLFQLLQIAFGKIQIQSSVVSIMYHERLQKGLIMRVSGQNYLTLPIQTLEEFEVCRANNLNFVPSIYYCIGQTQLVSSNSFNIAAQSIKWVVCLNYSPNLTELPYYEILKNETNYKQIVEGKSVIVMETDYMYCVGKSSNQTIIYRYQSPFDFYSSNGIQFSLDHKSQFLDNCKLLNLTKIEGGQVDIKINKIDPFSYIQSLSTDIKEGINKTQGLLARNNSSSQAIVSANQNALSHNLQIDEIVIQGEKVISCTYHSVDLPTKIVPSTNNSQQAIKSIYEYLKAQKLDSKYFAQSFMNCLISNKFNFSASCQYIGEYPFVVITLTTAQGQLSFCPNFPFVDIQSLGVETISNKLILADIKSYVLSTSVAELQYKIAYLLASGSSTVLLNSLGDFLVADNLQSIISGAIQLSGVEVLNISVEDYGSAYCIVFDTI